MQYAKEHDYSGWFSLEKIKLDIDKSLFDQVINIAKKNNSIITVGREEDDKLETAYVKDIYNEDITLECIDISNAKLYDEITMKLNEINFIEFNSVDNLLLEYANKKKYNS